MPGVTALTPARFALGLSADFRTTPGLIFFYSYSGRIAVTWRIGGRLTWLWREWHEKSEELLDPRQTLSLWFLLSCCFVPLFAEGASRLSEDLRKTHLGGAGFALEGSVFSAKRESFAGSGSGVLPVGAHLVFRGTRRTEQRLPRNP
jgi:hypothetical protein